MFFADVLIFFAQLLAPCQPLCTIRICMLIIHFGAQQTLLLILGLTEGEIMLIESLHVILAITIIEAHTRAHRQCKTVSVIKRDALLQFCCTLFSPPCDIQHILIWPPTPVGVRFLAIYHRRAIKPVGTGIQKIHCMQMGPFRL